MIQQVMGTHQLMNIWINFAKGMNASMNVWIVRWINALGWNEATKDAPKRPKGTLLGIINLSGAQEALKKSVF